MRAGEPELLGIAREAVELASELLRSTRPTRVTWKDDRDPASDLDLSIERRLRQRLRERAPWIGFLGEEEGHCGAEDWQWVLDPIDGTVNFLHNLPTVAVSLALLHLGVPRLGVVGLPFLGRTYWAAVGRGAYVGDAGNGAGGAGGGGDGAAVTGRRIRVSGTAELSAAIVALGDYATGRGSEQENRDRLATTGQLAGAVQRIRMLGSAAIDLVWVAEGRLDANLMMSNKIWDVAAGVVIAREAGAVVTDAGGLPHGLDSESLLAATPGIHPGMVGLLAARAGAGLPAGPG